MFIGLKNMWREKVRLAVTTGGVAVAILLILVLDGVFAGSERQVTIYMSAGGADLWVMQEGVSNMHMATSVLPVGKAADIRRVAGVREAAPIRYMSTSVKLGDKKQFTYLVGFDRDKLGGPWKMDSGTAQLKADEVVLDRTAAARNNLKLGDSVRILGRDFKIAGLSADTFAIANMITFIRREDFNRLTGSDAVNYILVKTDTSPAEVARRIEDKVGGVNALTTERFVASDRRMIRQMGIDIINAMAFFGFLVGLAVIGLTVYTLTLERSREFAVIKALGAGRLTLSRVVLEQTGLSVVLGLATGLVLAIGARVLIEQALPALKIIYQPQTIARTIAAMLAISVIASYMPIRRVFKVDPMTAFRK